MIRNKRMMIFYFGIEFTIILSIWMVTASLIEGKAIELLGDFISEIHVRIENV